MSDIDTRPSLPEEAMQTADDTVEQEIPLATAAISQSAPAPTIGTVTPTTPVMPTEPPSKFTRATVVTLLGTLMLLIALFGLLLYPSLISQIQLAKNLKWVSEQSIVTGWMIVAACYFLFPLLSGIAMLRQVRGARAWAVFMLIALAVGSIILEGWFTFRVPIAVAGNTGFGAKWIVVTNFALFACLNIVVSSTLVYFLTRPVVKESFKS